MVTVSTHTHTFAGNPLDRGEALRRDEASIDALAKSAEAVYLPFSRLRVLTHNPGELGWTARADLPQTESSPIFLGLIEGKPHFAIDVTQAEWRDPDDFEDCRAVAAVLSTSDTGIVAQGRAQLDWHRRNRFCGQCGAPNKPERGGQIRRCTACQAHIFPRTDPVVIMLIVDRPGGEQCLLGQAQGRMASSKFYSALAGFVDQGESLEEAVRREVWEEAGLRVGHVQYHSSQPWPFPSSLMIGCHGLADTHEINIDENEMADVAWFSREAALDAVRGENPDLMVPGAMAIAHHLIRSWATGEVTL
jgi:NAD+ diphosphatase